MRQYGTFLKNMVKSSLIFAIVEKLDINPMAIVEPAL
jgi:hypothetical protein